MQGLNNLEKRLNYRGGASQESRMQEDKLRTLKKALIYSYQAETIVLEDNRAFRALINRDKTKGDYDNEFISIPYKDICLGYWNEETNELQHKKPVDSETTTKGLQEIGMKPGDTFTLIKKHKPISHWLVYLEYLAEDAYFRAEIRRCDQTVEIDGKKYWIYIRGPVETSIPWNQKGGIEWNDMNYSLVMYIKKDENTINKFHRFETIKIKEEVTGIEKTWQVVGVNAYYGDGIIQVNLDEYFENSIADARKAEEEANRPVVEPLPEGSPHIEGDILVKPYSEQVYEAKNVAAGGSWHVIDANGKLYEEKAATPAQNNNSKWLIIPETKNFELHKISDLSTLIYINISEGTFKIEYLPPDQGAAALTLSVTIDNGGSS